MQSHPSVIPGSAFLLLEGFIWGGGYFPLFGTQNLARTETGGLGIEFFLIWNGRGGQILRFCGVLEEKGEHK